MRSLRLAACAALLVAAGCASSDDDIDERLLPPSLDEQVDFDATLKSAPVTTLRLGTVNIKLGDTTLEQTQSLIGAGKIQQQGGEENRTYWLCYTAGLADSFDRVWLISTPPAGAEKRIGLIIGEITSVGGEENCPLMKAGTPAPAFDQGIWLRMTRDALATRLGPPSGEQGGGLNYHYEGTETVTVQTQDGPEENDFDVTGELTAELQSGSVVRLTASRLSTPD